MTRFSDLRKLYDKWCMDDIKHYHQSCFFMNGLAEGLRAYLAAPHEFRSFDGSRTFRYVSTLESFFDEHGELKYEETPTTKTLPELNYDKDGYLLSGLSIVLDKDETTWPRRSCMFPFKFIIRDKECELIFGVDQTKTFKFSIDNQSETEKLYEFFLSLLEASFKRKPWDVNKQNAIGFITHEDK
jgi:hypothetical protein